MPRAPRLEDQRTAFLPLLAEAFSAGGYRRTTTAELARRCGVQETILYRLWPDKRAMFLAAIDYVFLHSQALYSAVMGETGAGRDRAAALRLLDHQAEHLGDLRHHRIVFAGLSESDDPEIRRELVRMYKRFHGLVAAKLGGGARNRLASWGIVALATFTTIARELDLVPATTRRRILAELGRRLMGS